MRTPFSLLIITLFWTSLYSGEQTLTLKEGQSPHVLIIENEYVNTQEDDFWEIVTKSNKTKDYKYYLKNYPNGKYNKLAKYKIKILKSTLQTYSLTIDTQPIDADIRIINIKKDYQNPMQLELGRYKIKVTKKNYEPKFKSLYLDQNISVLVKLRKVP